MKRILYFCLLWTFVFHQESMSDLVTERSENQADDNLKIWKINASENVRAAHHCIDDHYHQEFRIEFEEKFGNVHIDVLRNCTDRDLNVQVREKKIADGFYESIHNCYEDLLKPLLGKLDSTELIDPNFVSSSRDEIDVCYKKSWEEWKPQIFDLIEDLQPCIQKLRTPVEPLAEYVANYRNNTNFKNYCVIENGVLTIPTE